MSYSLKPCIDCGCQRPQLITYTVDKNKLIGIQCPDCDKRTDAHATIVGACEQWEHNKARILPDEVRKSIKKITARHNWRSKKKDYMP